MKFFRMIFAVILCSSPLAADGAYLISSSSVERIIGELALLDSENPVDVTVSQIEDALGDLFDKACADLDDDDSEDDLCYELFSNEENGIRFDNRENDLIESFMQKVKKRLSPNYQENTGLMRIKKRFKLLSNYTKKITFKRSESAQEDLENLKKNIALAILEHIKLENLEGIELDKSNNIKPCFDMLVFCDAKEVSVQTLPNSFLVPVSSEILLFINQSHSLDISDVVEDDIKSGASRCVAATIYTIAAFLVAGVAYDFFTIL